MRGQYGKQYLLVTLDGRDALYSTLELFKKLNGNETVS